MTSPVGDSLKRPDNRPQLVWIPLGVNLLASLLWAIITLIVASLLALPWWLSFGGFAVLFVLLMFLNRGRVTIRWLRLRIYKEVSSSKCGDKFIALARYCFTNRSRTRNALTELQKVIHIRKHPNSRLLQPIEEMVAAHSDQPGLHVDRVIEYLNTVMPAKTLAREEVVQNLTRFVVGLGPNSYIVLYGYSSTVGEALLRVGEALSCPVFVVQDLQYGRKESLSEHEETLRRFSNTQIRPYVLSFDQITTLCSRGADFVRVISGEVVSLERQRRIVALIGCEGADVKGNVLIPSKRKRIPSETAKFVEVFHQDTESPDQSSVDRQIVVVMESYKVHESFSADSILTYAPIKVSSPTQLLYLFGLEGIIRPTPVELVKLSPEDIYAAIDDHGIHLSTAGRLDLAGSLKVWQKRIRQSTTDLTTQRAYNIRNILHSGQIMIFDMNGVLLDDESAHFAAYAALVRMNGNTFTKHEYAEECLGLSDEEGIQNLIQKGKLKGDWEELLNKKRERYREYAADKGALPFHNAVELVHRLASLGKICYLVTSSSSEECVGFLAQSQLEAIFTDVRRYCNVQSADREQVYKSIIEHTHNNPSRYVVFDDSPANLALGMRLGMKTIAFATTRSLAELTADIVVEDATGLLSALEDVEEHSE